MRIEVDIQGNVTEHEDDPVVPPTEEQILAQKLNEARQYLSVTDHKFYGDYEPKEGEDLEAIRLKRKEAREFIRANRGE